MTITWNNILIVCGGIACIGGGVGYIIKLIKPVKALKDTVNAHSQMLDRDNKRFIELEGATKVQNKVLLALVSHEINVNSIDKLKQAKESLEDYLIEK